MSQSFEPFYDVNRTYDDNYAQGRSAPSRRRWRIQRGWAINLQRRRANRSSVSR